MSEKNVFYLDVDEITPDPNQPRKTFNEDEIASLSITIESQGQINPIEINGDNRIVTGEIRWRAVKKAAENNPNKPLIRLVKCTRWSGTPEKRYERQVIENLHHHSLTEQDRDKAIVKLWDNGEYPTMESLGRAVGLTKNTISNILEAHEVRTTLPESNAALLSTRVISDTAGLERETREKILIAVSEDKVMGKDVRDLKKIAQASPELLEKALEGNISVERAVEAAETVTKIESRGVELSGEQRQRLADQVARDARLIENYEEEVLEKVRKVMTAPPTVKTGSGISEPIGRLSPVNNMISVKDDINDNFRRYIGNCDMTERVWAKRIMEEIRASIDELIELVTDE